MLKYHFKFENKHLNIFMLALILLSIMIFLSYTQLLSSDKSYSKDFHYRLGSEVLVSNNINGGFLRCEPSVAISKNRIIVSWNDSYGGKINSRTGSIIGWAISKDLGKNFKFGGYLPIKQNGENVSGADSWLMADKYGNFYLQVLNWQKDKKQIEIYYMNNEQLGKWQKRTNAVVSKKLIDKPAMYINDFGKILIVYSGPEKSIFVVYSENKGMTWSNPIRISDQNDKLKTGASISMVGNKVVACWMEGEGFFESEVWCAISNDGGRVFKKPHKIYVLNRPLNVPDGYALGVGPAATIANNTWLASTSNGGSETFFLTCAEGTKKGSNILLFSLSSGKINWSGPIRVGNSPDSVIKVFPSITTFKNNPIILYYDRRNNPDSSFTDVYLSILTEESKFQDIKINTISTDWNIVPGDKKYAPIQRNFGDYITIASINQYIIATWTDGRNGKPRIFSRIIEILKNN